MGQIITLMTFSAHLLQLFSKRVSIIAGASRPCIVSPSQRWLNSSNDTSGLFCFLLTPSQVLGKSDPANEVLILKPGVSSACALMCSPSLLLLHVKWALVERLRVPIVTTPDMYPSPVKVRVGAEDSCWLWDTGEEADRTDMGLWTAEKIYHSYLYSNIYMSYMHTYVPQNFNDRLHHSTCCFPLCI